MITNKNERMMYRYPKDPAGTPHIQKKGNVVNPTSRLKYARLNKSKQEPFPTPAIYTTNKHRNCCPPLETPRTSKKTTTNLKMKSVSLVDLPSEDNTQPMMKTLRKTVSREQRDVLKPRVENRISNIYNTSARETELAKYVCRKFILQAWRKSRVLTNKLQLETTCLNKKVENLRIQNCVLKDLLQSDNERVTQAINEVNLVKTQLEEEINKSKLQNEHISRREVFFSEEKESWHAKTEQMKERIEYLKTELDQAVRNGLQVNEKALSYKEQLEAYRKTQVSLEDKLEVSESSLKDQIKDVKTLKSKCMDLQMTVEGLLTRNQELVREKEGKEKQIREYINNLKNLEVELNNFHNIQKVHSSDFVKLKKGYEDLKSQISNKNLEIGCLQDTIKMYKTEEEQLKNKLRTALLRTFQLSMNIIPWPNYIPF